MLPIETIQSFFQAIVDKHVERIRSDYVHTPETYVFVEGPRWSTHGYERVAEGWHAFTVAPLSIHAYTWIEGPLSQTMGDMAWVAGIVELQVEVAEHIKPVRVRCTFVLRRDADTWLILHEHVSQPVSDPYGIGDWLPQKPASSFTKQDGSIS